MPSWSFYTIGEALNTKLGELVSEWLVGTVYNYDPKADGNISTPCIVITPDSWEEYILDTSDNETIIPFIVALLDQWTDDRSAAETNLRSLADAAVEKIKDIGSITYSNGKVVRITYTYRRWRTNDPEPYRAFVITVNFLCVETK